MGKYRDRKFTAEELDEIISQLELEHKQDRERMGKEREQRDSDFEKWKKDTDCRLFLIDLIEFCKKIAYQDYGKEDFN